jgi:hypothetical protein
MNHAMGRGGQVGEGMALALDPTDEEGEGHVVIRSRGRLVTGAKPQAPLASDLRHRTAQELAEQQIKQRHLYR